MNIKDFNVGQTVYVELRGNEARNKPPDKLIEEWEVFYVGRKYIKACKKGHSIRETFECLNGQWQEKTNYCVNYFLYPTKEEILEKHKRESLRRRISDETDYISGKFLTLDQLQRIYAIIEESEET